MDMDISENYKVLDQRLNQFEKEVEHALNFVELRKKLFDFKNRLKEVDVQPTEEERLTKKINWLLFKLTQRERKVILDSIDELESQILILQRDFTQKIDLEDLKTATNFALKYCDTGISYLEKNPDKRHTFTLQELRDLKSKVENFQTQIININRQRSQYTKQRLDDLEAKLSSLEVELKGLPVNATDETYNRFFKELKDLLNESENFSNEKREALKQRILFSLDILNRKRTELNYPKKVAESQSTKDNFQAILNDVEKELTKEHLGFKELIGLKNKILNEVRKPLIEKTEHGYFKINLKKEHRNELFENIKALLNKIDQKFNQNKLYVQECKKNKQEMDDAIIHLRETFEKYRDDYYEGIGMNKHNLLKSLNEILEEIKIKQQELKSINIFNNDKHELYDAFSDLWTDVTNFMQVVAQPTWSMEWLMQKLETNKKLGNAYLRVIDRVPSP